MISNLKFDILIGLFFWEILMCNFIGMEYLAALALIKEDVNEISLSDLNNYGINIMKTFEENKVNCNYSPQKIYKKSTLPTV